MRRHADPSTRSSTSSNEELESHALFSALQRRVAELEAENEHLKRNNGIQAGQISALQNKVSTSTANAARLDNENKSLSKSLDKIENNLTRSNIEYQILSEKYKETDRLYGNDIRLLRQQVAELQGRVHTLNEALQNRPHRPTPRFFPAENTQCLSHYINSDGQLTPTNNS